MARASDCPTPEALQAFVLGRTVDAETDQLALHVETCMPCVERLHTLGQDDALVDAMRQPAEPRDDATAALIDGLVERLCDLSGLECSRELARYLAPAEAADELGRLGDYRVLKVLGLGGMGIVFAAEDARLGRQVALKVLRPRLLDDRAARQRFLREARAAAGLTHDYIMPILHIGEERGVPFLVMPLLAGETLEQRLRRELRLPMAEVLRLGGEIATGLAAAHERGFIHRDIKPSNVWLESADPACGLAAAPGANPPVGRVKLLDFGLARAVGAGPDLTHQGTLLGTPAYMAPEQARGEALDERGDLFSLGCVLYRLTTGKAPFQATGTLATLRALELATPPPPHAVNPAVPSTLSALIVGLLAKAPSARPASARLVAQALAACTPDAPPPRRRRRMRLALALGLLGALMLAGWLWWGLRPAAAWGGFSPPVAFGAGTNPFRMTAADLDGDGLLDLVITNSPGRTVTVLLGRRDGSFGGARHFDAGGTPGYLAAADLNGDGAIDLVVMHNDDDTQGQSGTIAVLLGDGRGGFQAPDVLVAGVRPSTVVIGDLNGDGKPDLVVAHAGSETLSQPGTLQVLLGKGDGTFHVAQTFGPAGYFCMLALGDFDNDGRLDLAVTDSVRNLVSVFRGKGDGSFAAPVDYPAGPYPTWLARGDLNGDGAADLVALNPLTGEIHVLLGNGDGTFQAARASPVGAGKLGGLALDDFDGDGTVDLIVGAAAAQTLNLLLGNGDGTFAPPLAFPTGKDPEAVLAADFDGDGRPDVAVLNPAGHDVSVFLNWPPPAGTPPPARPALAPPLAPADALLAPAAHYGVGWRPTGVAVADVDRDGRPDLIVADTVAGTVSVLLGQGDGTFRPARAFATDPGPNSVVVGDFNGDGKPDLAVANGTVQAGGQRGSVSVLLGNGDGTFQPPAQHFAAGPHPGALTVGDFDGDGRLDLAVAATFHDGMVCVLLGNGDGTFQRPRFFPVGQHPVSIEAVDLDGDGRLDLLVANGTSRTVSFLRGKGDGTFRPAVDTPTPQGAGTLALADFNRDGKLDAAMAYVDRVVVLLGNGDGTFAPGVVIPMPHLGMAAAGDLDGDGNADLVVSSSVYSGTLVSVLLGKGDGTFAPPVQQHLGGYQHRLALGDLNGDGRPDVVITRRFANQVSVLLNRAPRRGPSRDR